MNIIKIKDYPNWFVNLNAFVLMPILLWPIVAFLSIFATDSPSSGLLGQTIFLTGFGYPILLIAVSLLSFRYFKSNRNLSLWLCISCISLVYSILSYLILQIFFL